MADRDRIVQIARSHVDCSAVELQDIYMDVVVRPADRGTASSAYYFKNPTLSTCALFALGVLRLAGCADAECVAAYFPGRLGHAMADIQTIARRHGAWVSSSPPVAPLRAGDIWIIADDHGMDAHTGVCLGDAEESAAGSWVVPTAEGGQPDGVNGWTAVRGFWRTLVHSGNRWMLGNRALLGYLSADKVPASAGEVST